MKENRFRKRRGLHQIALAALFTVGNTLLRFPWANAEAGVTVSFLLSGVVAPFAALALYAIARFVFRRQLHGNLPRMGSAVVFALIAGSVALDCAARCTGDAVQFVKDLLLPVGTAIPFSVLFLSAGVLLARIPRSGMDLFALLGYVAVTVAVAVLFLRGAPQFRAEYATFETPTPETVGKSLMLLLSESVLPVLPLAVYLALSAPATRGNRVSPSLAVGVAAGFGLMFLCVLQTVLTFGVPYAATLSYPYLRAVRVVSVGQYAFRPELISYVLDYVATLVRTAVCLACLRRLVGRFLPRLGRVVPVIGAIGIFIYLYIR